MNKWPLQYGLTLVGALISTTIIGDRYFEIRSVELYEILQLFESLIFIIGLALIIHGIYLINKSWKWFLIIPLISFLILFIGFNWLIEFPNEIKVKEDTQILYIDKRDNRRKIIKQDYWTGVTGSNYNSDTLFVFEFNPYIRISKNINNKIPSGNWLKVK